MSTETTFWTLTENPPKNTERTASLASWSTNYDTKTGTPFGVFLDLIGYSKEEFGGSLVTDPTKCLGFLEYGMLADALTEYSNHPNEVNDFIRELISADH